MMKKVTAFVFLLCVAAAAFAADDKRTEMPRLEIPSAQTTGFGGAHVAFTDNVSALLVNPAAIMRVRQRSFFAPSFTIVSPQKTFGLLGKIGDGADIGLALEALNNPGNPGKIPFGAAFNEFPISIAWVADGFGFGIWDRIAVNANISGTNAEAVMLADLIVPVGFAFKILDTGAHDVDAGVALKLFGRGYGKKMINITEVIDNPDQLVDDLGVPIIFGVGMDLGFIYRWDIGLSAGLTFDDIFNHGSAVAYAGNGEADKDGYYVPFSLNMGIAYDLKIGAFWQNAPSFIARTGVTFAFDWRSFDLVFETENPYFKRNPALGIGLGLQFTFIDIFKLRLGMNEMLPAFGVGFDLGTFEFDMSYYGREFGLEPGQMPAAAVDLAFAIRPGAKERNWPWTRGSLTELIKGMVEKSKEKKASDAASPGASAETTAPLDGEAFSPADDEASSGDTESAAE
ncbi:MAG: hypothetical protein LBO04_08370 [Spirochaetaceae bacterium]|jgi:hypothetical protein|nr:hypothetical protein [Spirochaetaceae bacterium]